MTVLPQTGLLHTGFAVYLSRPVLGHPHLEMVCISLPSARPASLNVQGSLQDKELHVFQTFLKSQCGALTEFTITIYQKSLLLNLSFTSIEKLNSHSLVLILPLLSLNFCLQAYLPLSARVRMAIGGIEAVNLPRDPEILAGASLRV